MIKKLSKYGFVAATAVIVPTLFFSDTAQAISRGVPQADGVICRVAFSRPHIHAGEGQTKGSEEAAMASAIVNWSAFTRLEYGRKWGDWNMARKKSVNCSGKGSTWRCILKAQPCKH